MAEGFEAVDYLTNLRLPEVQRKRLWLVRVPRQIDPARLEGIKVKLPGRSSREGKVLGKVVSPDGINAGDSNDNDQEQGGGKVQRLVLRSADIAESSGFRALFSTEEDGALRVASPFAGQLNVAVESHTKGVEGEAGAAATVEPRVAVVEPYRGRPQLKGMRVRSKPAGAGSVYSSNPPMATRQDKGGGNPPATPIQERKKPATANGGGEVKDDGSPPVAEIPTVSKRKKKRKSMEREGGAVQAEAGGGSPSSATKKAKKKKSVAAVPS